MKYLVVFLALCAAVIARPQEGGQFTNEAIKQAQSQNLIPPGAIIQDVSPAITLGAYENLPANQPVNLLAILGDHVPREVISNIQTQIDQIN